MACLKSLALRGLIKADIAAAAPSRLAFQETLSDHCDCDPSPHSNLLHQERP